MHQMFSIYTTPKEFENGASTGHVGFVWNTGSGRKIIGMSTFSKSSGFFFFNLVTYVGLQFGLVLVGLELSVL